MSNLKVQASLTGTGVVTLTAPTTNTDRTVTLPDQTGTVLTNAGPFTANASASAGAVTIDASNNVGIGTSSPGNKLHVNGDLRTQGNFFLSNSTGSKIYPYYGSATNHNYVGAESDGSLSFGTGTSSPTERMRIDNAGNVGIGTSSPGAKLDVNGQLSSATAGTTTIAYTFGGQTTKTGMGCPADGTLAFYAGTTTERARITSGGDLLVGTTGTNPIGGRYNGVVLGSGGSLDIRHASNTSDWGISSTSGTIVNFYSDNGSAAVFAGLISVNGNTTSYASVSDYRLKEDIQPMTGALARVTQLKPVTYKWKSSGEAAEGFIAHELQAVVPDCVTGEKDAVDAEGNPIYQGIDTSFLVATLTAAIQEQQALIESLTARIAALEAA